MTWLTSLGFFVCNVPINDIDPCLNEEAITWNQAKDALQQEIPDNIVTGFIVYCIETIQ